MSGPYPWEPCPDETSKLIFDSGRPSYPWDPPCRPGPPLSVIGHPWDVTPKPVNKCPGCGNGGALIKEVVVSKVTRTRLTCLCGWSELVGRSEAAPSA